MGKGAKVTVILMITCIILYVIINMFNNHINNTSTVPSESGDVLSGENIVEEPNDEIEFEVVSGDNEIVIVSTTSGEVTFTKYVFENDKVVSIVVTEELVNADIAQGMYDLMLQDEKISQIYSSIDVEENIITMTLREEFVKAHENKTQAMLYEELIKAMGN